MSEIKKQIEELEIRNLSTDFWNDPEKAKSEVKKYEDLKSKLREEEEILKGGAIVNIFTGAGGDDAEDWSKMLFEMYEKFCSKMFWQILILDKNENSSGTEYFFQISGKNVYKTLRNESGVHRLIRLFTF